EVFAQISDVYKGVNVLLYETREAFADTLTKSLESLELAHTVVYDQAAFLRELESRGNTFDFVFVSSFSYGSLEKQIHHFTREDTAVTLICTYGELSGSDSESELTKSLFMPAHTADIAELINHRNAASDSSFKSQFSNFIAPDARVLIVDDINTNLVIAKGLLSVYKMQIDTCASGCEALEALQKHSYDLVFMDHMMPEMDGIETVAQIRELEKEGLIESASAGSVTLPLPIVALTANAVSGVREMFIANGFNDFIAKPIEITLLDGILKRWLPESKLKDADAFEELQNSLNSGGAAVDAVLLKGIKIKGVDAETGVYMTGGNVENYLKTLAVFKNDGVEKINTLCDCLAKDNLALYAVHVHALKSATASIGAAKLSKHARALEISAKNNDWDFVIKNNVPFIEELSELLENIGKVLTKIRTAQKQKSTEKVMDTALVGELATRLKSALEAFDMEGVEETLAALREQVAPDSEYDEIITKIASDVLVCEFDEALELAAKLTG
ncbi:MAG: response regulator, partial [Oscillospiraceae bacterium]|nr:response regulator [Oscillospiraceae bacterium]